MAQVERIRLLRHVERHSQRKTAELLRISRHTVAKYEDQSSPPGYNRSRPYICPVLGPFKADIERLFRENAVLPRKQRWIGHTIFECLRQLGYQGSESSVRRHLTYLRKHERKLQAHMPLGFDPGEAAEFDWGQVQVILAGQQVKVQMFCYRLRWSHMIVVRLYPTQRQEAMLDGLRWAFEVTQGVVRRVVSDNLAAAVKEVLEGHNRKEQDAYRSFRAHYLFESHFCTPGAGWEKGSVENLVGFAQRNVIGPHLAAATWDELNDLVWQRCLAYAQRTFRGEHETVATRWQQEQRVLRSLPKIPFECCRTLDVVSNGVSCVRFETCSYSVPVRYARQPLTLRAHWDRIEVSTGLTRIARHPRCYERDKDILDLDHYLELLLQKPGGLDQAAPFRAATLPEIYHQFRAELRARDPRGDREFIRVLLLHRDFPQESVAAALTEAHSRRTFQLEAIRQILFRQHACPVSSALGSSPQIPPLTVEQPAPASYDRLWKRGVVH